jgi:hypothetical protein
MSIKNAFLLVVIAAGVVGYFFKPKGNSYVANEPVGTPTTESSYTCSGKVYCSEMTSCEEAMFYLHNCPGTKMDGDNDGIPCEKQWCGR